LNPQRTLERGYAIVSDAQGSIVRDPAQLTRPARLRCASLAAARK
jgi:exonuclease VII large subunit